MMTVSTFAAIIWYSTSAPATFRRSTVRRSRREWTRWTDPDPGLADDFSTHTQSPTHGSSWAER